MKTDAATQERSTPMNQEVTHAARRGKTYRMAMTALMAAVTCVLAPMEIGRASCRERV